MRSSLIAVLLVASALACTQCRAQADSAPFSLTISAAKSEVTAGSDIFLAVTMTNTSDHAVNCQSAYNSGLNRSYRYSVVDLNGERIREIRSKHPELDSAVSVEMCTLQPGESITQKSRITRLYDLRQPGKFEIQVTRSVSNNAADGLVSSNKITVTVVEPTRMR